jgi:hypothetical protein
MNHHCSYVSPHSNPSLARSHPAPLGSVIGVNNYTRFGVHQILEMYASEERSETQTLDGNVIAIPHIGGLQHHYERRVE